MELLYLEKESETAKEGELAHEVAAATLLAQTHPFGATDEMLDGAELWEETFTSHKGLHVEETVSITTIHPACFGTPDLWFWDAANKTLHVADYKFGHRYVKVRKNWQLISYAIGIYRNNSGMIGQDATIRLAIVQPRSFHVDGPVRYWECSVNELLEYERLLQENCFTSMQPDAQCVTGPECRDCNARHACSTLQNSAYSVIQFFDKNLPFDLSPKAIGRELKTMQEAKGVLDARISGLEEEILSRIKSGNSVPGWITQQSAGREKWSCSVDEVLALGAMMGIDVSKPDIITPKQAIKAGLSVDLVHSYSAVSSGSTKLVPFETSKVSQIFGEK